MLRRDAPRLPAALPPSGAGSRQPFAVLENRIVRLTDPRRGPEPRRTHSDRDLVARLGRVAGPPGQAEAVRRRPHRDAPVGDLALRVGDVDKTPGVRIFPDKLRDGP